MELPDTMSRSYRNLVCDMIEDIARLNSQARLRTHVL
jgi:hypothetical protein